MRRWERLLELFMEEYRARAVSEASLRCTESRLELWVHSNNESGAKDRVDQPAKSENLR
jgi:hypothetical protein